MADLRQTSFAGGEISPLLHGRTDLPLFGKSCRLLQNLFVSKLGAAVSRPGTTYVNTTKFPTPPTPRLAIGQVVVAQGVGTARMVAFEVSDTESFALEFGKQYIRFHTLGATVLDPATQLPYEVATPYLEADLPYLKFAQVGEQLYIVSPHWDPYLLRHNADNPPTWSFTKAVPLPTEPWFVDIANAAAVTSQPFILVGTIGAPQTGAGIVGSIGTPDATHPAQEWQWKVTALVKNDRTGATIETTPQLVTLQWGGLPNAVGLVAPAVIGNQFPVFSDMPITLARSSVGPWLPVGFSGDTFTVQTYNYYRGRNGLFGYLGSSADIWFRDVGDTPNYAIQPPQGRNPLGNVVAQNVFNSDNLHQNRPSAVAFYQQRLVYGGMGTAEREQDIEASAQGNFTDFDQHNLIDVPGEALQITPVTRKRNQLRHLVSMRRLLLLGSTTAIHGGGSQQKPLDFDAMEFPVIEEVGAADVIPLVVDGACLFVRANGRGVHALVGAQDGWHFDGADLGQLAEHLFRGLSRQVVDWCYAREPWDVVWAVRADGTLLSLTFNRAMQVTAWAQHQFGTYDEQGNLVSQDLVESVCCVREDDEDAVYLVILRTISGTQYRYIERMTSRHARGGAQVSSGGRYHAIPLGGVFLNPQKLLVPPDYICLDCAIPYVGPAAHAFVGLGALEGRQVYALAQGQAPLGPFTVTNGAIDTGVTLQPNVTAADGTSALVLHVGIPYACRMELLDVAGQEARTKMKQVSHVGFEVDQTLGIQVGQDFQHLDSQPERQPADNFDVPPLTSDIYFLEVQGSWDYRARAVLQQALPLPTTVLGITRRLLVGT